MLVGLSIRDIVLIDRLDLAFGPALTVLTGETGAGKSILLDAFALALGGRGDGGLVRHGQAQGQVTASFELARSHPAIFEAQRNDIETDGNLILRRTQLPDGRTRAFVNDQPVGVQLLKQIGALLVEIHGQHDDRALADSARHRDILDAYGGLLDERRALVAAFGQMRALANELEEEGRRIEKARADADYLRHSEEELRKLGPEAGEEEQLARRRSTMQQAEKSVAELREAHRLLGGDGSLIPTLASAMRRLERRAALAPTLIDPPLKAMDSAIQALELAADALERSLDEAAFDPAEFERVEERLFALRAAARKYSVPVEQLAELAHRFSDDLLRLDAGEAQLQALGRELAAAERVYSDLAAALSERRKAAAEALDQSVAVELAPLKLERAVFMTKVDSDPASRVAEGIDRVEFWVQTNPGTRPGPMMKIASGGELSRFMLALKVALADRGSAPTLVFDEIDTGVGGAVADAIGQRLAKLASKVQVLAVTHAPQVAARASSHLRIAKDSGAGGTVATRVAELDRVDRREEIARMLAGATITEEARAAAGRLIDGAILATGEKPKRIARRS